jgi:spermidine/putrescine-binding protein
VARAPVSQVAQPGRQGGSIRMNSYTRFPTVRRLIVLSAVLALLAAACGDDDDESGAQQAAGVDTTAPGAGEADDLDFTGETLVVGTFSQDVADALERGIGDRFREDTGASLQFVGAPTPQLLSQLIAARGTTPPYDVLAWESATQQRAASLDLLDKPDYRNIPNVADLAPSAREATDALGYGPHWISALVGNCYNVNAYQQNGIDPPVGADAWFDPKVAGHIVFPNNDSVLWQSNIPGLTKHFGLEDSDAEGFIEKISAVDFHSLYTSSSALQQEIVEGDIWLAAGWNSGRCLGLKKAGEPFDFAPLNLQIDGKVYEYLGVNNTADIAAGTDKKRLAEHFINLLLTPEAIVEYTKAVLFTPLLQSALDEISNDPESAPFIITDVGDTYYPDYEVFFATIDNWHAAWNRAFR